MNFEKSLVATTAWRRSDGEDGEGKVTPLELFLLGVIELEPNVLELIRAAA